MALSADRNTPHRRSEVLDFPIKAGATIYRGALAVIDANGDAAGGSTALNLKAVGRAETGSADNPARVRVRRGTFLFKNSAAGDAITAADYGATIYIVDDETVAKTNGTNTRSVAGICRGVDPAGVWVET